MRNLRSRLLVLSALTLAGACSDSDDPPAPARDAATQLPPPGPSMIRAVAPGTRIYPLLTVSDNVAGYRPPGVPDGLGAWRVDDDTVRILLNHELRPDAGYPYELGNGTRLTGARISVLDVRPATLEIASAGLAYDEVRDRSGLLVNDPSQINEIVGDGGSQGFGWFCSAAQYRSGQYGFVDDVYFTHEEATTLEEHPHGGSVWALDIGRRTLWAAPMLGRGSWENLTAIETPDGSEPDGHIALLLGDDFEFGAAPLYLWLGRKNPEGNFLERNGLADGTLHVWVANNGDVSPDQWHGDGTVREGRFVPVQALDESRAGEPGYDRLGFLNDVPLRDAAAAVDAFMFSRPEDLHTDPEDGSRAAFASTGQGDVFPTDDWGILYLIDMSWPEDYPAASPDASLTILHDANGPGDFGIRNPDNLVWAGDGMVYVQEDKATKLNVFGERSGRESAIWRLDPDNPADRERITEIDRRVVLPSDATDNRPKRIGHWESSGIIDVTGLFPHATDELALLVTVQAHGIRDGAIGGKSELVRGGQLSLVITPKPERP